MRQCFQVIVKWEFCKSMSCYSLGEALRSAAVWNVPCILWRSKVRKSLTCPYPKPDNPVHGLAFIFLKVYFNSFSLTTRSAKLSSSFRFPHQSVLRRNVKIVTCPVHLRPYWFDYPNKIWRWVQIMKLTFMQCFSSFLLLSPSSGPNIFLSILF